MIANFRLGSKALWSLKCAIYIKRLHYLWMIELLNVKLGDVYVVSFH